MESAGICLRSPKWEPSVIVDDDIEYKQHDVDPELFVLGVNFNHFDRINLEFWLKIAIKRYFNPFIRFQPLLAFMITFWWQIDKSVSAALPARLSTIKSDRQYKWHPRMTCSLLCTSSSIYYQQRQPEEGLRLSPQCPVSSLVRVTSLVHLLSLIGLSSPCAPLIGQNC